MSIKITGISSICGLGSSLEDHAAKINKGQTALRLLNQFSGLSVPTGEIHGAWIEQRDLMLSRKWAPASALAIHAARAAIADAKLEGKNLEQAAVIAGTSRGNAWLQDWEGRRPFKLMAASNTMHGEIASAVTIEFGIHGPWQVIASGCAASLDALGMAYMMLKSGVVKHAIVLGVELPLVDPVVQSYLNTGVLSKNALNDPYSKQTSGFHPGESASALVLEADAKQGIEMLGYWCNSDAESPIGMPKDGRGLRDCLKKAKDALKKEQIQAICPHASGTYLHAQAEQTALKTALKPQKEISLHLLKPFTGHTVGASGLLDTAILSHYLRHDQLPPNLPNMTPAEFPFSLPTKPTSIEKEVVLKIAVGMGGHNSIVALKK